MVFIGDDTERMKAIEALLIEAHEAERTRVARELHDDIGQRMAVLTMDLDALSQALPLPTTEVRARIDALSDRALDLAKGIQALSHQLYPAKLDYLGLGFRAMPSRAIRLSSVVGLRPRRSAAPPRPRTRQLVLSSTARICSTSSAPGSWRPAGSAVGRRRGGHTTSWRPVATITARSMTLRSSRTLPGHG
jgi:hypothetical protein